MASKAVRRFLWRLDTIETAARKQHAYCTGMYLHNVTRQFMAYWREIQQDPDNGLEGREWDELYFLFNQKLRDIAYCRLDMFWMIYEHDEQDLFHKDHEQGPFWRQPDQHRI